jgi:hypothetical protein
LPAVSCKLQIANCRLLIDTSYAVGAFCLRQRGT